MTWRESVTHAVHRLQDAIDLLNQALLDPAQRVEIKRKRFDYLYEAIVAITAAINELESVHDD